VKSSTNPTHTIATNVPSSESVPTNVPFHDTQKPTPSSYCKVDENGFFGAEGDIITILYNYQMEYNSTFDLDNIVLPNLERGISNAILKDIFKGGSCNSTILSNRNRDLELEMIVGVSSDPEDIPIGMFQNLILLYVVHTKSHRFTANLFLIPTCKSRRLSK
jgi:hypothetical protein